MASAAFNNYAITVCIEDYHECKKGGQYRRCKEVTATATVPGSSVQAGSATAYILDRCAMQEDDNSYRVNGDVSESTDDLVKDMIFWRDCCMEAMLLVHEVIIAPEYRRQGLGRKIVAAMLEKARETTGRGYYALAAPGYLGAEVARETMQSNKSPVDEKKMIEGRLLDTASEFWRSLGFACYDSSLSWVRLVRRTIGLESHTL